MVLSHLIYPQRGGCGALPTPKTISNFLKLFQGLLKHFKYTCL